MHEAVEAALGVGVKEEDGQAEKGDQPRAKRTREASEDDEEDKQTKRYVPSHSDQLAQRRQKDRQRYASMTPDQRQIYNAKRREQYHRQSETSRQRRRERERSRYHSLTQDAAKERNARRAKLERERYQRLSPEELEAKVKRKHGMFLRCKCFFQFAHVFLSFLLFNHRTASAASVPLRPASRRPRTVEMEATPQLRHRRPRKNLPRQHPRSTWKPRPRLLRLPKTPFMSSYFWTRRVRSVKNILCERFV